MLERLQKILSARGIASRRKAEEYIEQGLVTVNGKVAILGQKADPQVDTIKISGKVLEARQEMLYYVMYKPVGVETSNVDHDKEETKKVTGYGLRVTGSKKPLETRNPKPETDHSQPTVRQLLPADLQGKIYPVGRLDKDSEGLLLFTNDGVLAYRLTHPKFDHEKEYEVTVAEPVTDGQLRKIQDGVKLDGEKTKQSKIRRMGPATFRITLTEGRYRQIRRMSQKVGAEVIRLVRVRIMTFVDSKMASGNFRPLTVSEKEQLLQSLQITHASSLDAGGEE